jgi:hypothetical protein
MNKYIKIIFVIVALMLFLAYIQMEKFNKTDFNKTEYNKDNEKIKNTSSVDLKKKKNSGILITKNIKPEKSSEELNLQYKKVYDLFKSGNCLEGEEFFKKYLLEDIYNNDAFDNLYDLRVNCIKMRKKELINKRVQ